MHEDLSSRDKLRLFRCLTGGAAPTDPRLAAVAIEWAESYKRRNRLYLSYLRWLPLVAIVVLGIVTIPGVIEGELVMVFGFGLVLLGCLGQFFLNPFTRPKNVERCLEASRHVLASRGG